MAIRSQNTRLEIGDGNSPEAFANVAGVTDINGFSGGRPLIDITTLASTGREFITGIADYGTVDFNIIYDRDIQEHLDIYDLFQNGESNKFRLVFSNSPEETYTFDAYVQNFANSIQMDEVVRTAVTLKVTGTPVDNNA